MSDQLSLKKHLPALTLFLGVTLFFYVLVHFFTVGAIKQIELVGTFSTSSHVNVFNTKPTHGFRNVASKTQEIAANDREQTVVIKLHNRIAKDVRLQFSDSVALEGVKQVSISSHFQSAPMRIQLPDETVLVQNNTLQINNISIAKHPFVHYVLPLALSALMYLFIRSIKWQELPALVDLRSNQQARNTDNLLALDGLRGIAALTVLFDHTIAEFLQLGRAGVWLFFTLSGFLLVRSFVLNPEYTFSIQGLKNYFIKRIRRILPMLYAMVTIVYLFNGWFDQAIRHYLLIQADGHYWTILYELYFYILLPFIVLIAYRFFKQKHVLTILFLVGVSIAWFEFGDASIVSVYAFGEQRVPLFYVFILGMVAGYFYYGIYRESDVMQAFVDRYGLMFGVSSLMLMLVFFFYAASLNIIQENFNVLDWPFFSAVMMALLVLLSAVSPEKSFYNRLLSLSVLRLIGITGFSFYLLHPYAIEIFIDMVEFLFASHPHQLGTGYFTLVGAFILTLPVAMLTYSYIERPFLKKR